MSHTCPVSRVGHPPSKPVKDAPISKEQYHNVSSSVNRLPSSIAVPFVPSSGDVALESVTARRYDKLTFLSWHTLTSIKHAVRIRAFTSLSDHAQLVILSIGVFAFFITNGYVEEYLFIRFPGFKFGWFLTVIELVLFALFAGFQRLVYRERIFAHSMPLVNHFIVAMAVTMSRGLTNVSMQLLNYPTMVYTTT